MAGQIRCGLPRANTGASDLNQGGNTANFYRVTAPTAVNAAFLSYTDLSVGNCKTVGGTSSCGGTTTNPLKSSGGINNYMRMLESWGGTSGQYFNYSGSFVSLGTPLEYSGKWSGGAPVDSSGFAPGDGTGNAAALFYSIPSRNFNFDPNFTSFSGLPPMTPSVVYLQQEVFKRSFN